MNTGGPEIPRIVKVGDWVRPINGWMPRPGCIFGLVVGEAVYSRFDIPAWLVDGSQGETPPQLVPKDAVEYWFTPDPDCCV